MNGILLILGIFELVNSFQDGGSILDKVPGLNALTGGDQQAQIDSLLQQ